MLSLILIIFQIYSIVGSILALSGDFDFLKVSDISRLIWIGVIAISGSGMITNICHIFKE